MSSLDKLPMFENRLLKVFRHRSKLAKKQGISCYRIYDHDVAEFPFSIELYDDKVYVAEYRTSFVISEEEYEIWISACKQIIAKTVSLPVESIFMKERKRKTDRTDQYQKQDDAKEFITVLENGHKFLINLTDYLDTGLFLDHRITRKLVQDICKDKKVLNLFCYTGSFSVYAAKGAATKVTSVDLSNTYLEWAKDNFAINLLKKQEGFEFVRADVLQYLAELPANSYDIIVMDPPTFSNSKKMKDFLDIQQDHVQLINQALNILTPAGVLFFSTNYTKFQMEYGAINSPNIKDITRKTTPFDFEGKLKRWCYEISKTNPS